MPKPPSGVPPWKGIGLKLPPDLLEEVRRYSDIHRTSLSEVVREALESHLRGSEPAHGTPRDTLMALRELLGVAVEILDTSMARVQVVAVPEGPPVEVPTALVQDAEESKPTRAAILARIQALHAEGASLSEIARRLEAEGIRTLKGKMKWAKGTVDRMIHPRAKA